MRRLCVLLAAGALLLGLSGSASAGTFASGTIGLSIGSLPPITLVDNGITFTVCPACGFFSEPANEFGPADVPLPRALFTGVPSISGLTLASFGNGAVSGTLPSAVGGLQGSALVNVLGLINLSIPLAQVGLGTMTVMAGAGGIAITVIGQAWTTGMAVVTGITTDTPNTAVANTVTYTGGISGPLSGTGTITLVSAFKAITNVAGNLPGLAIQTLRFVPEPGVLMLLGSSVGGLLVAGWLRMRR